MEEKRGILSNSTHKNPEDKTLGKTFHRLKNTNVFFSAFAKSIIS